MKVEYLALKAENLQYREEIIDRINQVLDTSLFILGPETEEFENNISSMLNVTHVIGVNSCTDALFLALKAIDIKESDEVIVPANSFLSSATSITNAGGKPVFIDIKDNYLIDEGLIEKKVTKRTKAIIPVHLTGKPCNMDRICSMAKKYDLHVIEDCAQAVMAKWKGKYVGTYGLCGCFSLHPLKNLSACGDGGFITTNDETLYNRLLQIRNIGLKNRNESDIIGFNSRLDSLQAAIVNVKLKYIDEITHKRRQNANLYYKLLSKLNCKSIKYIPQDADDEFSVFHTFVIRAENRDELAEFLKEEGVETKIHYPIPIHKQNCYSSAGAQVLSNVEEQAREIISLPIHQFLTRQQIEFVCQKIEMFYKQKAVTYKK
ncbi:MAG: DegT/DnrJ/EryC1/StrS family aminotransferase [Nanoarchaeota archaeon]|nr:DegT/DnrJ/EryC1/StrS family aminotransferase [Nanoarchaeota archaeon]